MLVFKNSIKLAKNLKQKGKNIQIIKSETENEYFQQNYKDQDLKYLKANIVEGNSQFLETKKVPLTEEISRFSYFLDGIERKRILFNYNYLPVTYGYVSAVIMKRTEKKMHSVGIEDFVENLYAPIKVQESSPEFYMDYKDFKDFDFKPKNIGEKDKKTGEYPLYPLDLENIARSDIQETRGRLERGLAKLWVEKSFEDGWLFLDGRLENKNNDLINANNIVGVIKSHHVQYFSPNEQYKIYELKKGERTSIFRPVNKNGKEENVLSWYLRLHTSDSKGKRDFGIIRVEVAANEKMLKMADQISNWILLETNPIAFPASRFDRMIYPIKYCEDYLKSKAPSWTVLESLS